MRLPGLVAFLYVCPARFTPVGFHSYVLPPVPGSPVTPVAPFRWFQVRVYAPCLYFSSSSAVAQLPRLRAFPVTPRSSCLAFTRALPCPGSVLPRCPARLPTRVPRTPVACPGLPHARWFPVTRALPCLPRVPGSPVAFGCCPSSGYALRCVAVVGFAFAAHLLHTVCCPLFDFAVAVVLVGYALPRTRVRCGCVPGFVCLFGLRLVYLYTRYIFAVYFWLRFAL